MWLQMALFLRLSSIPFYTSFYPFVCQWTVRLFHVLAFELASFADRQDLSTQPSVQGRAPS